MNLDYTRLIWYIQNYAESVMGIGSDHVLEGCDTVYRCLGKWTTHQESTLMSRPQFIAVNSTEECSNCQSDSVELCTCGINPEESGQGDLKTVQNLFAQLLSFSVIDENPSPSRAAVKQHQIGVLIVACGRSPRVWAFSQRRNSWIALPSLPSSIRKAGLVALAGSLYIVGGMVEGLPTAEVWRLDVLPASWHLVRQPADSRPVARWVPVRPMPTPRAGHASTSVGDRFIIVVGGYGPNGECDSILGYDRVKDIWFEAGHCASVPRVGARLAVIANYNQHNERSRHSSESSCTSENKVKELTCPSSWTLLEVGGLQAGGRLAIIDCYSIIGKQTSSDAEMPESLSITFSGEQLLLPQPVRYAEPIVLLDDPNATGYERFGDCSSRVLVVCSDFGNSSTNASCYILSFDLKRRLCRVAAPNLPGGTRVHPAVSRSFDGKSIFIVGGKVVTTDPPLLEEPANEDENRVFIKPVGTVELFDEEVKQWKTLSSIPEARSGHCAAQLVFVNK